MADARKKSTKNTPRTRSRRRSSVPKVDTRVLGDLAAQLAQQAGQKFLEDQFNKGLEKLLRPRGAKP